MDKTSNNPAPTAEAKSPFGRGTVLTHPTPHHGIKHAGRGERGWARKEAPKPK